jgi:2-polyprenyl-3-methyl-5-hydroxy-6-metoxy-1,4-benzoquinol methylase
MKCPVCGSEKSFTALFPEFCDVDNYLCMECGLVFIPREEKEVHDYYSQDGYFEKSPNLSLRKFFVNQRQLYQKGKRSLRNLESRLGAELHGKRVLDIGCGYGELVGALAQERGALAEGLEASPQAAGAGEKMFNIRIHVGLLENFKSEVPYDVITCHHTLEHIANPYAFMENVKRLLIPGGKLYFEVPNILWPSGGFSLRQFLYAEHVQNFSASNLSMFFCNCGLSVEAYDDRRFLKFWLASGGKDGVKVPPVTPETVIGFLRDYRKHYGVFNTLGVYADKGLYLIKLVLYSLLPPRRFKKPVETGEKNKASGR